MNPLPTPYPESLIYQDDKLYCCLATYPLTKGHTVVVWKSPVSDLHLLSKQDYLYLMEKVDLVRNALIRALNLEKVYLMYVDEANQVHWHLVPRYNEKGYNILVHQPTETHDFSLASIIRSELTAVLY